MHLKKDKMQKKFKFRHLVTKIANFAVVKQNNSIFTHTHTQIAHFNTISPEKSRFLTIFDKIILYLWEKIAFKIN